MSKRLPRTVKNHRFYNLPNHAKDVLIDSAATIKVIQFELELIRIRGCTQVGERLSRIASVVGKQAQEIEDYTGISMVKKVVDPVTGKESAPTEPEPPSQEK